MAGLSKNERREVALERALALITEALDLLDAHRGPPEATAHLDLAVQKVKETLRN